MRLEEIGFYTLLDERAKNASATSPMWRCELILTDRCNFSCVYCRGLREDCWGDMPIDRALWVIDRWADDGLKNVRFSGGEPMTYLFIEDVIQYAAARGIERVAISTNGSFPLSRYERLVECGLNDLSISLDACCAAGVDKQAGISGFFDVITENIRNLSRLTYVTVGIVLTEETIGTVNDVIRFAHDLGVADIRIISAAQWNGKLIAALDIEDEILGVHPILKYRVNNLRAGRDVRSLSPSDAHTCWLMQDDSVVAGEWHFPCVIYMREGGNPISRISDSMRADRIKWMKTHNTYRDDICRKNCLDVCIDYNNRREIFVDE